MAGKVTFDTVRKIGLQLPGVEASTSYGAPSLKVNGQLLACPAINKSAEPGSIVIRVDFDQRDALIAEAPDTYYVTDHYMPYPSVLVRLSRVNSTILKDLLQASWKYVTTNSKSRTRRKPR
jgi:hypothetical protein